MPHETEDDEIGNIIHEYNDIIESSIYQGHCYQCGGAVGEEKKRHNDKWLCEKCFFWYDSESTEGGEGLDL